MRFLLLHAPFGLGVFQAVVERMAFLAVLLALVKQLGDVPLGMLFVQIPARQRCRRVEHRLLALLQPSAGRPEVLFLLCELSTAFIEVGLDLAMLRAEGGESLIHGRQGHFRGSVFLPVALLLLLALANLAVGIE